MKFSYERESNDIDCFKEWTCICFIGVKSHCFNVCQGTEHPLELALTSLDEKDVDFSIHMMVIITSLVLL